MKRPISKREKIFIGSFLLFVIALLSINYFMPREIMNSKCQSFENNLINYHLIIGEKINIERGINIEKEVQKNDISWKSLENEYKITIGKIEQNKTNKIKYFIFHISFNPVLAGIDKEDKVVWLIYKNPYRKFPLYLKPANFIYKSAKEIQTNN